MFGGIGARALVLLIFVLAALDPAAAQAAPSGDFAGLVDIGGGRKMYLECRGTGSPTVVLVAGLRASAEDWNISETSAPAVFPEVAKFTRVCAYDRPGTPVGEKPSRSDPVPQPATAGDAVADLHALLTCRWRGGTLCACRALLWRPDRRGFMRAPIPKTCPVSFSSTFSAKGFGRRRRLNNGRYSGS